MAKRLHVHCQAAPSKSALGVAVIRWQGLLNALPILRPLDVRFTIGSTTTDPAPAGTVQVLRIRFGAANANVPALSGPSLVLPTLLLASSTCDFAPVTADLGGLVLTPSCCKWG